MSIWVCGERVSLWNCWMIKMLLPWVLGLEVPQLDPDSFLLLQRISQWQQTPAAPSTYIPSLQMSFVWPWKALWRAGHWRCSWPVSSQVVLPLGREAAGVPSCAQPSAAQDGGTAPWKGSSRCAGESLDGWVCQGEWPVPVPSRSGISRWLLYRSPTFGGWKEWKMRYMGF